MPARGKDEILLKMWSSWEDGIGYLSDAKGTNGCFYANKLLGLQGELRPAPIFLGQNTAGVASTTEILIGDGVEDSGTANAAVTTTATTLADTREAWTTNEWIGAIVTCNAKTMYVTSNTATTLTGASWSGGGTPGNGNSWTLTLRTAITGNVAAQYFFEDIPTDITASEAYLYVIVNNDGLLAVPSAPQIGSAVYKINLRNTAFGAFIHEGFAHGSADDPLGSPMKYGGDAAMAGPEGRWYVPGGNTGAGTSDIVRLTTIASAGGQDTWLRSSAGASPTKADHLALLNFQGSKVLRANGASILATNGDPLLDTSWGSYNPVGDKRQRALGLQSLLDAMFVYNKEGLYSFNDKVQSGLVFQDFRYWRNVLRESAIVPFKGGLLLGHPSGLLFYQARQLPVAVGPEARFASMGNPPPGGPTEFANGRWHGVAVAGDFVYGIYQPTPLGASGYGSGAARNGLVMFGTPKGGIDPTNISWQVLGNIRMQAPALMHGCYVSTLGYPESATVPSPTLWVQSNRVSDEFITLKRMNLDNRATPFRARGETHVVTTTGEAWMSEMMFPDPIDLTELIVYTQDMASGDEWLFGLLIDGRPVGSAVGPFSNTSEIVVGNIVQSNGRSKLHMDVPGVHRVMLHVKFTGTSTTARVPPTIKRIELWGRPGAA